MNPITEFEKKLAEAVVQTIELREGSYDHTAADEATSEFTDYSQFYTKDLQKCAEEACVITGIGAGAGRLVYLAVLSWQNDSWQWAKQVLDDTAICAPTSSNCQHGSVTGEDCYACKLLWEKVNDEVSSM